MSESTTVDEAEMLAKAALYDRLIVQISALECVLATLSEWDLQGQPTGKNCRIGSAELVLREAIETLHKITGDVGSLEDWSERVREAAKVAQAEEVQS